MGNDADMSMIIIITEHILLRCISYTEYIYNTIIPNDARWWLEMV